MSHPCALSGVMADPQHRRRMGVSIVGQQGFYLCRAGFVEVAGGFIKQKGCGESCQGSQQGKTLSFAGGASTHLP